MDKKISEVAITAVRRAGEVLMRHFGTIEAAQIDNKQAFDFVTYVDKKSETVLIDHLGAAFPDHAFYAEESQRARAGGYRWIIDPLDGTTNYIHGVANFSISVALEHERQIILGIVFDPCRDELFSAVKGGGAFLNGRAIRVSAVNHPALSLLGTGFPFKNKQHLDSYLASFSALFQQVSGIRRLGSAALDLAYVACGRFEGFWELGLSPWDVAAGALLVVEAGGMMSDFAGGDQEVWNGHVVASNGLLHPLLLAATRKYLSPEMLS